MSSKIELSPWFRYLKTYPTDTRKVRVISMMALKVSQLKSCKAKQTSPRTDTAICTHCEMGCIEDIEHVLFTCPALNVKRDTHWNEISSHCPNVMFTELSRMSNTDKVSFLLSGLGTYTPEWHKVYKAVATFISVMYNEVTS